jgi:hypothetical protein
MILPGGYYLLSRPKPTRIPANRRVGADPRVALHSAENQRLRASPSHNAAGAPAAGPSLKPCG